MNDTINFKDNEEITIYSDKDNLSYNYKYVNYINYNTGQGIIVEVIKDNTHYALKVNKNKEHDERIINEGKFLFGIDNPEAKHIIKCHCYGYIKKNNIDYPALCLGLKDGDLVKFLKTNNLTMNHAIKWLIQLSTALNYLHSNNNGSKDPICHRDLKLQNILYDSEVNVFLADFGTIKEVSRLHTPSHVWTIGWQAPEQILTIEDKEVEKEDEGRYSSIKTDIYGLGLVFFNVFTNELPNSQEIIGHNVTMANHINKLKTDKEKYPDYKTNQVKLGLLGEIGGLTTDEITKLKDNISKLIKNNNITNVDLTIINAWASEFTNLLTSMLDPWFNDRPYAQEVLNKAQQLAAEFSPTVDDLKFIAANNSYSSGEEIAFTLNINGMGLPCGDSDWSWLRFTLNDQQCDLASITIQENKTDYSKLGLAVSSTTEKPATDVNPKKSVQAKNISLQNLKFAIKLAKIDQPGEYQLKASINYYSLSEKSYHLSETTYSFTVEATAEQLWQSGDHYAALAKEQRAEWLNHLLANLHTVHEAIIYSNFTGTHQLEDYHAKSLALPIYSEKEKADSCKPYQAEIVSIKSKLVQAEAEQKKIQTKLLDSEKTLNQANTDKANLESQLNSEKSKLQTKINHENNLNSIIANLQTEVNKNSLANLMFNIFWFIVVMVVIIGLINKFWYQPTEKQVGKLICSFFQCQTKVTPPPEPPNNSTTFQSLVAEANKLVDNATEQNHKTNILNALKAYDEALRLYGAKQSKEQLQSLNDYILAVLKLQFNFNNPHVEPLDKPLDFSVLGAYVAQMTTQPSEENISKYLKRINEYNRLGVIDRSKLIDNRYLPSSSGEEITDTKTAITWKRCLEGQKWEKGTCTGQAQPYKYSELKSLVASYGDKYRLPDVREAFALVECSIGKYKDDPQDGGGMIVNGCLGNYKSPTINLTAFPSTPNRHWIWTSSDYKPSSGNVSWVVNFSDGLVSYGNHGSANHVRLVRSF